MRDEHRMDSIFLTILNEIVGMIFSEYGVSLSTGDIVSNKQFYKSILKDDKNDKLK